MSVSPTSVTPVHLGNGGLIKINGGAYKGIVEWADTHTYTHFTMQAGERR